MTGPLEQKLGRIAERVGWRLRWRSERLRAYPSQTCTELDIYRGRDMLTREQPFRLIHAERDAADNGEARARETLASMVLQQLPRRGAGQRT